MGRSDQTKAQLAAELTAAQRRIADLETTMMANQRAVEDFERLCSLSPDVICVVGVDGRFERVNRALERLLGRSRDELSARSFFDFVHPDDLPATQAAMDSGRLRETALCFENRYRCQDGAYRWLSWHISANAAGRLYAIGRDVTGQKRAASVAASLKERLQCEIQAREEIEAAWRQAQELLEEQITALEARLAERTAELAASNAELAQFAYVASHDLQEPLRMISSYLQLLARRYRGRLDADADDFIAYAVGGAKRMQTLINDLLAYSRVGRPGRPFETLDCQAALDQALHNLQAAIEEAGAVITHDPLPGLKADGSQLIHLFQNLIDNAIKFRGGAPPCIHISAAQRGGRWTFAVSDNGIGIGPEYAGRIFKIFQRLHTSEAYPGTGIGLAICQKIVERHGGRIWVESRPGQGATFRFTLPGAGL